VKEILTILNEQVLEGYLYSSPVCRRRDRVVASVTIADCVSGCVMLPGMAAPRILFQWGSKV
jgi:hypothetical protein